MNKVAWRSPSNIALVKYWGKFENQLPANPSLSFTLSDCYTETHLQWEARTPEHTEKFAFDVYVDGVETPSFKGKIETFFERVINFIPFVTDYYLRIDTHNSFPHSSGIASSASGMAAMALCMGSMAKAIGKPLTGDFFLTCSNMARLGSGSASRSVVHGPLGFWGHFYGLEGSSDEHAIAYPWEVHPVYETFRDTVLLVDIGQKSVSSTAGHGLMKGHPFASSRFDQAFDHIEVLAECLKTGDLESFGALVEREALTLHALMMSGSPSYILMKPNTLAIIEEIWNYRRTTGEPIFFTLDAGANVHMLYPAEYEQNAMELVKSKLAGYCKNGSYICDRVGRGPFEITDR